MDTISKEQVIAAEKKLLEAIKNSDVENLDDLLHEDLLFHIPDGQTITKEMDLETHRSGNMMVNSMVAREQMVSIIGDSAVVSVLIETRGKVFDEPMEGQFRFMRIWKSIDRQLKVIGGSCMQI